MQVKQIGIISAKIEMSNIEEKISVKIFDGRELTLKEARAKNLRILCLDEKGDSVYASAREVCVTFPDGVSEFGFPTSVRIYKTEEARIKYCLG